MSNEKTLREAAERALAALAKATCGTSEHMAEIEVAHSELQAALADQAQAEPEKLVPCELPYHAGQWIAEDGRRFILLADKAQAEPVAYRYPYRFRDIGETGAYEIVAHDVAVVMRLPKGEPLYAAPQPAAQLVEIDYGRLVEDAWSRHRYARGTKECIAFKHGAEWAAAQPVRQPLTDEQIAIAWRKWPFTSITSAARAISFFRAVERDANHFPEPGNMVAAQPVAAPDGMAEDAARWRYAMDWGTTGFAVCKRVGDTGTCWEPIKTNGPIDRAMLSAAPKVQQ